MPFSGRKAHRPPQAAPTQDLGVSNLPAIYSAAYTSIKDVPCMRIIICLGSGQKSTTWWAKGTRRGSAGTGNTGSSAVLVVVPCMMADGGGAFDRWPPPMEQPAFVSSSNHSDRSLFTLSSAFKRKNTNPCSHEASNHQLSISLTRTIYTYDGSTVRLYCFPKQAILAF